MRSSSGHFGGRRRRRRRRRDGGGEKDKGLTFKMKGKMIFKDWSNRGGKHGHVALLSVIFKGLVKWKC